MTDTTQTPNPAPATPGAAPSPQTAPPVAPATAPAPATPAAQPPAPAAAPVAKSVNAVFADRTPCNWSLVGNKDGSISASNSNTGETFEGSMADFNAALRG